MRLTRRGPGRRNGSTRKQSSKNADAQKVVETEADKPNNDQQLQRTRSRSSSSCFDLDCNPSFHGDVFLPDDDQHNIQRLGNLPYLNSNVAKENQPSSPGLEFFMQQNYFELTDVNNYALPVPTDMQKLDDPIGITSSSRSQSLYGLSPELPNQLPISTLQ